MFLGEEYESANFDKVAGCSKRMQMHGCGWVLINECLTLLPYRSDQSGRSYMMISLPKVKEGSPKAWCNDEYRSVIGNSNKSCVQSPDME